MNDEDLHQAEEFAKALRLQLKPAHVEVPSHLYEGVLNRIRADLAAESSRPRPWKATLILTALTLVSLFGLYAARMEAQQGHAPSLLACGVMWGGMILASLGLTLFPLRNRALDWTSVSAPGLAAFAVALIGTSSCPRLSVLHVWQSSEWIARLGLAQTPGIILMGTLYAFIPALLGVAALGDHRRPNRKRQALASGAIFFSLLVPLIYLQCLPFSLGLFASWVGGALLGVYGGAVGGMRLRAHWASA